LLRGCGKWEVDYLIEAIKIEWLCHISKYIGIQEWNWKDIFYLEVPNNCMCLKSVTIVFNGQGDIGINSRNKPGQSGEPRR